jgi:hypothetical protein
MGDGASTIALYATAIAGLVWVLTPAIAFSLGLIRLRSDVNPNPAGAEPKGDDPDYERRFRQFESLGFRAAGTSRESCWFMNPHRWRWKQHGENRWMASPDGKVMIAFHRHIAIEPVRFSASSIFEGGGMVKTVCPGVGLARDSESFLRVEHLNIEPEDLVTRHQQHVDGFSQRRRRRAMPATVAEVTAEEIIHDRRELSRMGRSSYNDILLFFLLPALFPPLPSRLVGAGWHRAAIGVCAGAAITALVRLVFIPAMRSRRVMATYSASRKAL